MIAKKTLKFNLYIKYRQSSTNILLTFHYVRLWRACFAWNVFRIYIKLNYSHSQFLLTFSFNSSNFTSVQVLHNLQVSDRQDWMVCTPDSPIMHTSNEPLNSNTQNQLV